MPLLPNLVAILTDSLQAADSGTLSIKNLIQAQADDGQADRVELVQLRVLSWEMIQSK